MTSRGFSYESHELMREIIDCAGDKRIAYALGVTRSQVHRQARHPMDDSDPDGSGARNHLDRTEAIVSTIAMRGESARPLLRILRLWHDGLFERALERGAVVPLSVEHITTKTAASVEQFAAFLRTCSPMAFDARQVTVESVKMLELLDRIARAAQLVEGSLGVP